MKYGKRDANHREIRDALRDAGISVYDAGSIGGGFPDLVCAGYHQKLEMQFTALVEVKTDEGELTQDQKRFIEGWRGTVYIVRNRDEALAVFGIR